MPIPTRIRDPAATRRVSTGSPASVPGTAAGALRDAGRWRPGEPIDLDARGLVVSHPIRCGAAGRRARRSCSRLDGIATVAEVFLNGELVLTSESMFAAHAPRRRARCCARMATSWRSAAGRWRRCCGSDAAARPLAHALVERQPALLPHDAARARPGLRPRPGRGRARGGRCGWSVAGTVAVDGLALRTRLEGDDGVLAVRASLRGLGGAERRGAWRSSVSGASGVAPRSHARRARDARSGVDVTWRAASCPTWRAGGRTPTATPSFTRSGCASSARPAVSRGCRAESAFASSRLGPSPATSLERDGLDLHVNGVRVFARGRRLDARSTRSASRPARSELRRSARTRVATPA